jgi:hypothetical protein
VSMLTVDDELYQRATEAAAAQGKTVDEFVDEALRKALSMVGIRCTVRNGLPVMLVSDNTPPSIPPKCASTWRRKGFDCTARYRRIAWPDGEQPRASRGGASLV